ncbi:MICOS complex subunit Mic10-like [Paramacrobiotus metropolitanus]|uniref:MICOS complex subunit Mic10-like n=1 Tax=Paramacrobiotus metropolitanus TaxID=2943436 RepID=UPI0024457270|nr:MICOS complex subunit Mic10-like [Paramacrobiotus metropolitanus]
MPQQVEIVRSEDELGKKWDRCLSDGLIKVGGGVAIGGLLSLLFFKRRAWPILFGTGAGFGMSYSNCQNAFHNPYQAGPVRRKPVAAPPSPSTVSLPKPSQPVHSALESHPPQFSDQEMKDTSTKPAVPKKQ